MEHSQSEPVNSHDQTHLTEPIREKLQETAISPIQGNGGLSDDDPMAITRKQSKRARDHGEDDGIVPPLEREPRKRAATAKKAEEEDTHVTDAPAPAAEITALVDSETSAQPPTTFLDSEAAPTAAVNGSKLSARETPEIEPPTRKSMATNDIASPTGGKRSRSEFQSDSNLTQAPHREKSASAEPETVTAGGVTSSTERATKRQRSESPKQGAPASEVSKSRGFANISANSPFGALAKPSADDSTKTTGFDTASSASPFGGVLGSKPAAATKETSASAFASSGFGSFAGQTASPFGAAAKTNGSSSGFAAPAAGTPSIFSTPTAGKLGFGSSAGGFGALSGTAKPSGFGTTTPGSGFGGLASGPKLSGFGGPRGTALPPITGLSSATTGAFGAPAKDNNDDEDDDEGSATEPDDDAEVGDEEEPKEKSTAPPAKSKAEPIHISNGEENEDSLFISRAKLFAFVPDEKGESPAWRERGHGTLKINIDKEFEAEGDDEDADSGLIQGTLEKPANTETETEKGEKDQATAPAESIAHKSKARFVMRQDSTNKLVLNSPVMTGTLYGKQPSSAMTVIFFGLLPGHDGLQKLQIKMKADQIKNFWSLVSKLQGDAS